LNGKKALGRELGVSGGAFTESEDDPADETLLLLENDQNIPDEKTLRALDDPRGGPLRCLLASPWLGAELFCMLVLERACLQGAFALAPNGFTVCDGLTAGEALAIGASFNKVKRAFQKAYAKSSGEPAV
jgi:hypothetical protein